MEGLQQRDKTIYSEHFCPTLGVHTESREKTYLWIRVRTERSVHHAVSVNVHYERARG